MLIADIGAAERENIEKYNIWHKERIAGRKINTFMKFKDYYRNRRLQEDMAFLEAMTPEDIEASKASLSNIKIGRKAERESQTLKYLLAKTMGRPMKISDMRIVFKDYMREIPEFLKWVGNEDSVFDEHLVNLFIKYCC